MMRWWTSLAIAVMVMAAGCGGVKAASSPGPSGASSVSPRIASGVEGRVLLSGGPGHRRLPIQPAAVPVEQGLGVRLDRPPCRRRQGGLGRCLSHRASPRQLHAQGVSHLRQSLVRPAQGVRPRGRVRARGPGRPDPLTRAAGRASWPWCGTFPRAVHLVRNLSRRGPTVPAGRRLSAPAIMLVEGAAPTRCEAGC